MHHYNPTTSICLVILSAAAETLHRFEPNGITGWMSVIVLTLTGIYHIQGIEERRYKRKQRKKDKDNGNNN